MPWGLEKGLVRKRVDYDDLRLGLWVLDTEGVGEREVGNASKVMCSRTGELVSDGWSLEKSLIQSMSSNFITKKKA